MLYTIGRNKLGVHGGIVYNWTHNVLNEHDIHAICEGTTIDKELSFCETVFGTRIVAIWRVKNKRDATVISNISTK